MDGMRRMGRGPGGDNVMIPKAFMKAVEDDIRVEIAYKYMGLDVSQHLDTLGKSKSVIRSTELRLAGNEIFQKKDKSASDLYKVLLLYTESIAYAPYPASPKDNSQELALGFANRSALFFTMDQYDSCLEDIRLALTFKYPDHLKYKLLERRGRCLGLMGRVNEASKSLEEAISMLSLSALPENRIQSLRASLSLPLKPCASKLGPLAEKRRPPPKSYGENEAIPCASDCVKIAYSMEMGRKMVATRNINPGDVIIIEAPFASSFLPIDQEPGDAYHTHCFNCMKRVQWLIPCKHCHLAVFCSERCRQSSWDEFHRFECPIMHTFSDLKLDDPNLCYVLRILLVASNRNRGVKGLYEYIKEMELNQNENKIKGFNADGKYDSSDYAAVHNLLRHTEKRSKEELFSLAIKAAMLTRILDTFTDFFREVEASAPPATGVPDWKMFVGGLLLRFCQIVFTNSCGIADIVMDPGQTEPRRIKFAHGLYPTSSMLNHSCNPNVLSHIREGNIRAVMAVRFIREGEQLFTAFSKSYVIEELHQRTSFLKKHGYFTCKCEACIESWPTPNVIDKLIPLVSPHGTWICSNCRTVLPRIPQSFRRPEGEFIHICKRCKTSHGNEELKNTMNDIAIMCHLIFFEQRAHPGDSSDYRPQLAKQLMRLENLVKRPHPLFVAIQESLLQTFVLQGNYYKL